MKRFTVPCDFGGQKHPFHVYIGEPHPKKHPLQFQAWWLSTERGGTIPQDVMDSFEKLFKISQENNVSFEDLCVYALGTASEEEGGEAVAEGPMDTPGMEDEGGEEDFTAPPEPEREPEYGFPEAHGEAIPEPEPAEDIPAPMPPEQSATTAHEEAIPEPEPVPELQNPDNLRDEVAVPKAAQEAPKEEIAPALEEEIPPPPMPEKQDEAKNEE